MSREMKDSGVEWIGEIPEEWKMKKLKYLALKKDSFILDGDWIESPDIVSEGIRYYTTGNIGDGVFKEQGSGFISEETFKRLECTPVQGGDLVFSRLNAPIGRSCIIPQADKCIVSVDIVVVKPDDTVSKKYVVYVSMCKGYQENNMLLARGTTMQRVSRTLLENVYFPMPRVDQQQKIVEHLDIKCAEIDKVVDKTRESIEEYKKLKQAIITEAVTKGVRGSRPMKPSGVEWIGDIPEEWSKDKVIRICERIGSGTTPKYTDSKSDSTCINWLQSGDINGSMIEQPSIRISKKLLESTAALQVYNAPFIVLAMYGASIGNVAISGIDACVNQACCVLVNPRLNQVYLFYVMCAVKDYLVYLGEGGGQPNISQGKLKKLWVPVPQDREQNEIVLYLDTKCGEIDRLISKKEQLIAELEAYKKSLIYEYVTGKKEVPA